MHASPHEGLAFFFRPRRQRPARCFFNGYTLKPGSRIEVMKMDFHAGDPVIHWIYGFGEILRLEEKNLPGQAAHYYVVQLKELTVWVPLDGELANRLRKPTPKGKFNRLFKILGGKGEALSTDRLERRTHLLEELKSASTEANCRVIRDLSCHQQKFQLNEHDLSVLNRARNSLLGEWTYSLSVPLEQAERALDRLLSRPPHTASA